MPSFPAALTRESGGGLATDDTGGDGPGGCARVPAVPDVPGLTEAAPEAPGWPDGPAPAGPDGAAAAGPAPTALEASRRPAQPDPQAVALLAEARVSDTAWFGVRPMARSRATVPVT